MRRGSREPGRGECRFVVEKTFRTRPKTSSISTRGSETGMSKRRQSAWPFLAANRRAFDLAAVGLEAGIRSLTHSMCPPRAAHCRASE